MSLVDLVRLTLISCGISETVEKTAAIKPIIAMYSILNQTLRLCHHIIYLGLVKEHSLIWKMQKPTSIIND